MSMATVTTAAFSIIVVPIFTKLMDVQIYGIWSVYITIVSLLTPVGLLGLHNSFVRFAAGNKDIEKVRDDFYSSPLFVSVFSLLLSFALILAIRSSIFLRFADNSTVQAFFKLGTFLVFVWAIETFALSYYRTFLRMRKYAILITIQVVSEMFLLFLLALRGFSLIAIIASIISVRMGIFIFSLTDIFKEIGSKLPHFYSIISYLIYGLPLAVSGLFIWVIKLSDRLLIGYFMDVSSVGIYSAAYNIASVIMLYLATFWVKS